MQRLHKFRDFASRHTKGQQGVLDRAEDGTCGAYDNEMGVLIRLGCMQCPSSSAEGQNKSWMLNTFLGQWYGHNWIQGVCKLNDVQNAVFLQAP